MKIICDLCDREDIVKPNSMLEKRLKHKKLQSYLCNECEDRITKNTMKRHATGKFKLYRSKMDEKKEKKRSHS